MVSDKNSYLYSDVVSSVGQVKPFRQSTASLVVHVHLVLPKPSCKAQRKREDGKADRGRGGKTTSGNGQGMDMPGVRQVPEGSGEQRKMEETGCEII